MFILLLLISFLAILFLSVNRNRFNLFLLIANLLLLVMTYTVSLYIAKKGGINIQLQRLFFITPAIRKSVQYYYINLNITGYLYALTKFLFPLTIFYYQMKYSENKHYLRYLKWILLPVLASLLILYIPHIYKTFIYQDILVQQLLMNTANLFCVGVLFLTLVAYVCLYRSLIADFIKNEMIINGLYILYLAIIYVIFFLIDPGALYNFYTSNPTLQGSLYMSFIYPNEFYYVLFGAIMLCFISFLFSLIRYFRTYLLHNRRIKQNKETESILNPIISSIFHSFKNEILAYKVLIKRMKASVYSDQLDEEKLKKNITILESKNKELYQKIEGLYDSIKISSQRNENINIQELMTKLLKKYEDNHILKSINDEIFVYVNPQNLMIALESIIDNAIEAVELKVNAETPMVSVQTKKYLDYCLILISDNGEGILAERKEDIFKPFYSEKNSKTNWGMGLYTARRIVMSYGGNVEVHSEPNKGTSFLIFLPISKGENND